MPILVVCLSCNSRLRANDDHIGRTLRCPACKTAITVPAICPPPPGETEPKLEILAEPLRSPVSPNPDSDASPSAPQPCSPLNADHKYGSGIGIKGKVAIAGVTLTLLVFSFFGALSLFGASPLSKSAGSVSPAEPRDMVVPPRQVLPSLGGLDFFGGRPIREDRLSGHWEIQDVPDAIRGQPRHVVAPTLELLKGNFVKTSIYEIPFGQVSQFFSGQGETLKLLGFGKKPENPIVILNQNNFLESVHQGDYVVRVVRRGAYSLSRDESEMELVHEDGKIEVFPFSRTENTIRLGDERFVRQAPDAEKTRQDRVAAILAMPAEGVKTEDDLLAVRLAEIPTGRGGTVRETMIAEWNTLSAAQKSEQIESFNRMLRVMIARPLLKWNAEAQAVRMRPMELSPSAREAALEAVKPYVEMAFSHNDALERIKSVIAAERFPVEVYYYVAVLEAAEKSGSWDAVTDSFVFETYRKALEIHMAKLAEAIDNEVAVQRQIDHGEIKVPQEIREWMSQKIARVYGGGQGLVSDNILEKANDGSYRIANSAISEGDDRADVFEFLQVLGVFIDASTYFKRAATEGSLEVMKRLNREGVSPEDRQEAFSRAVASASGRVDILQWLKEQNVDIHVKNWAGESPLHRAAHRGHIEIMQWLLDNHADINAKDEKGVAPVDIAERYNHVEAARWLRDNGAKGLKDIEGLELTPEGWLLGHGFNSTGYLLDPDRRGAVATQFAALEGRHDVLAWLQNQGRDVLGRDNGGGPHTIHLAAEGGHIETMKWLKEQGADINTTFKKAGGWEGGRLRWGEGTPMHSAAYNGHIEAMAWLRDQGADINSRGNPPREGAEGNTPIYYAAENGQLTAVKWLKDLGANLDSSLMHAAALGRSSEAWRFRREQGKSLDPNRIPPASDGRFLAVMKYLREQGVAIDSDGRAIRSAAGALDTEMMTWLMEQGADINTGGGGNADTPLQQVAYTGNLAVLKWMVTNGADLHHRSLHEKIKGHAAVHIAASGGHLEMLKWILQQGANINDVCTWDNHSRSVLDFAEYNAQFRDASDEILIWPLFDLIFHLSIVMMRRTGHQPHGNTF